MIHLPNVTTIKILVYTHTHTQYCIIFVYLIDKFILQQNCYYLQYKT